MGKQDPFARLLLNEQQVFQTKVIEEGGKNVDWNESYDIDFLEIRGNP